MTGSAGTARSVSTSMGAGTGTSSAGGYSGGLLAPYAMQALAVPAAVAIALGAWAPLLDAAVLWALPVALAATALTALRPLPRLTGMLAAAWLPTAILLAGVPIHLLWPTRWLTLLADLSTGALELAALGPGRSVNDPLPVAVWLLLVGMSWLTASALAGTRSSVVGGECRTPMRAIAFVMLTAPWLIAVTLRQADDVAWQGAALLFAALVWFAPRRAAAVPVVAIGAATALLAAGTAYALGPRDQWFTLEQIFTQQAQFSTLDTTQTYGPLRGRRTGATMLEVTAPEPALWRMQVLDRFGWRGWEVGRDRPMLPQPAARQVNIQVQVKGLRDNTVVAPGKIRSISAPGKIDDGRGEAFHVLPMPQRDDNYQITADVVRATPEQLRAAPWPTHPDVLPYLRLMSGYFDGWDENRWGGNWRDNGDWDDDWGDDWNDGHDGSGGPPNHVMGVSSDTMDTRGLDFELRFLEHTPYSGVVELARQLAAGARSPFEVVQRVQSYLQDDGRFQYSTDVEEAGRLPLAAFLMDERVGYCQHFAGAAALLLRMTGVPARVVAGFATGQPTGDGRFIVRDADAHAWIEVYFEGIGWVPFNPTPADADAEIPLELDPLAPPAEAGVDRLAATAWAPAALPAGVALGVLLLAWRRLRGRRTQLGDVLEWVVRRTGRRVVPSTTLAGLRTQLAGVGPHTAALATVVERAQYAPGGAVDARRPLLQVARALRADLGVARALLVLLGVRADRTDVRGAGVQPSGSGDKDQGDSERTP